MTDQRDIDALRHGALDVEGRMPWSSNATFLVNIEHDDHHIKAIYKPSKGERPLWDFPDGLYRREIAAYELSRQLGWDLVPPTVERDGAFGVGSLQLFIDADFEQHHFTMVEDPAYHAQLRRICAFDLLANNTDRKSGHCLLDDDGHIWGIDHGLCFSAEFKLRTVIWDFAGEAIEDDLVAGIEKLADGIGDPLIELLSRDECGALYRRALDLLDDPTFPHDHTGRRWPWPLV